MLGRTANGLYWLYRYMERAENIARLIETGQRIALTRLSSGDDEWASVLQSAGAHAGYAVAHESVARDTAVDWLLRSPDNPSSVVSCISNARQNARQVRTAVTTDAWEAINAAYMSLKEMTARRVSERDLPAVLRRVRQNAALVRGMTHGTMLRNEIYDFCRLGTFMERADNTARILDVKYYVLLPSSRAVGTSLDNVQWETILRSLSAHGGFRMEYGLGAGAQAIAQFLILDTRMPRSLAFCTGKLGDNLRYLSAGEDIGEPSREKVHALEEMFTACTIEDIFEDGLHEFLQDVLNRLGGISRQIEVDFRFYE